MEGFHHLLQEHKSLVQGKLEALNGFKESILQNESKIDQNQYEIEKLYQAIQDFKYDDLFVNAQSNYAKVYQELSRQSNQIELEFRPEIEKVKIDKTLFVKHAALAKTDEQNQLLKTSLEKLEAQVSDNFEKAEAVEKRVKEMEDRSPAARRKAKQATSTDPVKEPVSKRKKPVLT